ncbi:N-6 DNA methylase [Rhabdothermincola salaria]|uniref:N-6 DNA methylase n=1 Tax=Rhabdothermincola salaria TaxID=2903142 RepID=UPI001E563496|nr:N-6 DNA methylase [Rhabdothermincola salaria]MCD9624236.1 SAM-dependent methyltransferase [Rhabdothermincola salaria]
MAGIELDDLVRHYGDESVSLPTFCRLVSGDPKLLLARSRRSRDFPQPTNAASSSPLYRLTDLAGWLRSEMQAEDERRSRETRSKPDDSTGRPVFDQVRSPEDPQAIARYMHEWALERSVELCARRHGVDATRLLVAGTALVRSERAIADALRTFDETVGTDRPSALLDDLKRAYRAARQDSDRPVSADAALAYEPRFVEPLLTGRYPGPAAAVLRDDPDQAAVEGLSSTTESGGVVREIWGVWSFLANGPQDPREPFAETIDQSFTQLSGASLKVSRSSPEQLTQLLVEIADIQPGMRLLDPACGQGNTLIAAAQRTMHKGKQTIELVGRDLDVQAWTICRARLTMRGLPHDLGTPGPAGDSLGDGDGLAGAFDRVVAEPGTGMWLASRWLSRSIEWLRPEGTAVIALPLATLGYNARNECVREKPREAAAAGEHVAGVVVTCPEVREETREPLAVWVLTETPVEEVLFIDMRSTDKDADPTGGLPPDTVGAVAEVFSLHRSDGDLADGQRPLGVKAKAVVRSRLKVGTDYWPAKWLADPAEQDRVESAKKRALRLTESLRAVVDSSAPEPEDPMGIELDDLGQLSGITTAEMKRALLRLENLLSGTVTRGRKKKPGGQS